MGRLPFLQGPPDRPGAAPQGRSGRGRNRALPAELALAPAGGGTTELRRQPIALSGTLCTYPHWAAPTAWRAGSVELRRAARTHTSAPAEGLAAA
ncbi:hypothetical protein OH787_40410 (plasmid) [Streptomyces sp. NBC_01547]|uniref:hypothetical protein n=1 Tax=unclassified Streptomyces TaxID=2593676 RepID=UPI000F5522F6|nr:hypothetical protein [Streptomyces sp. ADI91-18]RPK23524.1 hypothetical protein EES37_37855 [Streptomyces sp. ADI91-18]